MDVKLKAVEPFSVAGLQVRTRNTDEQQADTARIGPMWERFFTEGLFDRIPARQSESFVYGVYSNYESDATGYFDVTAGVEVDATSPGYPAVDIEGGDYLVFSAKGAMPDCVIQTWGLIWAYFADNPQTLRRFATDFEVYSGPDAVAIYIGVQSPDERSSASN
ncbi:GyrI-like domain-containing protein [Pseudomonas sp. B21-056]|jgi:predicted transcriptional regulator YdeE|uniref:GyrI-like domain-containing protein n=1 Tax=Pseudomonas sp. B21-056 TaxID=2895495 RepID=UPI002231199A|nr:GyrI-like domain-containing protein [Pseudomonas sp. B21-056]UZE21737.1 GyrI-like domain-containing protein [Pseudomonas sp. B21-056]